MLRYTNLTGAATRLLALVVFCLFSQVAISQTWDTSQPPGENFDKAQFRLWIPEGLQEVKAILVLVPGSNGDGRDQVEAALWQGLAKEKGLALVGLYMTDKMHDEMFIEHYVNVAAGSGDALLAALDDLASLSGHAEISDVPLLLWGMSAGGEFNYEFALWRPERVAGFVVNKGGIYYSALASSVARNVPGLFFVGTEDLAFRNDIVRGIFSINRRAHALWALFEQDGVAHAVAGSDEIAAAFYREILDLEPTLTLRGNPLAIADGYFCDPVSKACVAAAASDAPRTPVSWLATETLAGIWQRAHGATVQGK